MSVNFNFAIDSNAKSDFDPLPAGSYNVVIQAVEDRKTNAGTGRMLNLKMLVEGPTHAGRYLFTNINYQNPSEACERMGRAQLGQIAGALGINMTSSDQMLNGRLQVKVVVSHSEKYGDGNDVKGFKAPASAGAHAQMQGAPVAPQYAPQAPAAPQYAPVAQAAPVAPPQAAPAAQAPPYAQAVPPLPTAPQAAPVAQPQAGPPHWAHQG